MLTWVLMTCLAQYLAERNETVRDFAQRAGCDKSTISRAKNGKEITLTNAQRIVKATGGKVGFDDLLPRRSGKRN
jgi:predicted transcriptional regulator